MEDEIYFADDQIGVGFDDDFDRAIRAEETANSWVGYIGDDDEDYLDDGDEEWDALFGEEEAND